MEKDGGFLSGQGRVRTYLEETWRCYQHHFFFSVASIIISPNQRSWDSKHSPFFPLLLTGFDLQTSMHSMGTHPEVFIYLASVVPPLRDPVAQNPSPENHR